MVEGEGADLPPAYEPPKKPGMREERVDLCAFVVFHGFAGPVVAVCTCTMCEHYVYDDTSFVYVQYVHVRVFTVHTCIMLNDILLWVYGNRASLSH